MDVKFHVERRLRIASASSFPVPDETLGTPSSCPLSSAEIKNEISYEITFELQNEVEYFK
jgi:hypothetical protein